MDNIFEGVEITEEVKTVLNERFTKQLTEANGLAVVNANKILDSIASNFANDFGVERLASETKITDYLKRATKQIGEKATSESSQKIRELEEKIKLGITDETTKKELDAMKAALQKLNSELESERKAKNEIETNYTKQLNDYKVDNIIASLMPAFDKDANKYEIKERKAEAIKLLKENYNLKINDSGELIPENKTTFLTIDVEEFLKENLKDLLPKNQTGGGAMPPKGLTGLIVFTSGMTGEEKNALVHSALVAKGYKSKVDEGYAAEYAKLYKEATDKMK